MMKITIKSQVGGLTGITGTSSSNGNSKWPSTNATSFILPPHMSITLLIMNNTWYSCKIKILFLL